MDPYHASSQRSGPGVLCYVNEKSRLVTGKLCRTLSFLSLPPKQTNETKRGESFVGQTRPPPTAPDPDGDQDDERRGNASTCCVPGRVPRAGGWGVGHAADLAPHGTPSAPLPLRPASSRALPAAPLAGARPPTQIRSCARTTLPLRQATCSAVRPSTSPLVSFTSSREPCASSRMTARRSSSAVARSRCWPRGSSAHGSGARNSFCSYLARIQRSLSSLRKPRDGAVTASRAAEAAAPRPHPRVSSPGPGGPQGDGSQRQPPAPAVGRVLGHGIAAAGGRRDHPCGGF